MSFSINLGSWNSIFAVPSDIVDKHIRLAGAAQLKVLLYILRHSGNPLSLEVIAEALAMHSADIEDAIQYWIELNILIKTQDGFSPPPPDTSKISEPKLDNQETQKTEKTSRPLSDRKKPDSFTLTKRMEEAPEIAYLIQEAQVILGKTISPGDCQTLLMFHDTDGLPVDVILMLLQYAASIDKKHIRYIEQLAINWSDEEIDSVEKAEAKIFSLTKSREAYWIVQKITGIEHHSPTAAEVEFCSTWIHKWKFSEVLIRYAYERCVDTTGKFSFKYTNKILENWFKNNITTIQQAVEEKIANKRASIKGQISTYDIDAYENSNIFDE